MKLKTNGEITILLMLNNNVIICGTNSGYIHIVEISSFKSL